MKDLDDFLDALPLNVGYNALIAAGLVCLMGAVSVWFSAQELQKVSQLHADLTNVQALQPPVPVLKYVPVSAAAALKPLIDKVGVLTFKGVKITTGGEGEVSVSAPDTDYFPQFLAAISYIQRGGRNWKVTIRPPLCVGRDCKLGQAFDAKLKVERVLFRRAGKERRILGMIKKPRIKSKAGNENEGRNFD